MNYPTPLKLTEQIAKDGSVKYVYIPENQKEDINIEFGLSDTSKLIIGAAAIGAILGIAAFLLSRRMPKKEAPTKQDSK